MTDDGYIYHAQGTWVRRPGSVPSVPRTLAAVPTMSTVAVTWVEPADLGGSAVTGYVTRLLLGSTVIQTDTVVGLSKTFTGLTASTGYTVEVSAVNNAGTGPPATISVTTSAVPTAPGAPTSLAQTHTSTAITATWAAPASDGGSPVTGYRRTLRQGVTVIQGPTTSAGFTHTFTGLSASTAYTVGIAAVNAVGTGPETTVTATTSATGTVTNAAMAYPAKSIVTYDMLYNNLPNPLPALIGSPCNVIRLSFAVGSGPSLVGRNAYASDAAFGTALRACRDSGIRIQMSFGGSSDAVNWDPAAITNLMINFSNNICPLDGMDDDSETGTPPTSAQLLSIMATMKANRGDNFHISFAPPGGNPVAVARVKAEAQKAAGNSVSFGQQTYVAVVDNPTMAWVIDQATSGNLDVGDCEVGCMNPVFRPGGDAVNKYWTNPECVSRVDYVQANRGQPRGAYYWQANVDNLYYPGQIPANEGAHNWYAAMAATL